MQIHVTKNGKKQGPYTIYRIKEMVDAGDLQLDTLAWHEGLPQWCALQDIPVVASTLKSLERKQAPADGDATEEIDPDSSLPLPSSVIRIKRKNTQNSQAVKNVHPILRFWARMFDLLILNLIVGFVFGNPPVPEEGENLFEFYRQIPMEEQFQLLLIWGGSFFVWNFVEALLISSFATTPGKMLFNLKVIRKDGKLLSYSQAIGRALLIWTIGVGFGILFLQIIGMVIALFYLLNKGETLWDKSLQTQVIHQALGPRKVIFAVGAFLILLSLQTLSMP
ncbi:MAG: RDD family protein [Verrucomicrobiales bacterium]|nr:RDD family protein [Verrucomicrobiales bacterium]